MKVVDDSSDFKKDTKVHKNRELDFKNINFLKEPFK